MRSFLLLIGLLAGLVLHPAAAQQRTTPRKAPVRTAAKAGVRKPAATTTKSDFARTPSGIEYQLFRKNAAGRYQPRPLKPTGDAAYTTRAGKLLTVQVQYRTGRDSLLLDSRQQLPLPQPFPLPESFQRGSLEEAISLLLPGDSAVFRFQVDSIFNKTFRQQVPSFLRRGNGRVMVYLSAYQLLDASEGAAYQQKMQAAQEQRASAGAAKQTAIDEQLIQDYLRANKLGNVQKTPGGTYYVITQPGEGPLAQAGQVVSVLYRGTLLTTGKEFDATSRRGNQPFSFPLGQHQVIQGWDQGIAMLKKGSKATLLIPSPLGYGARGAGADIPANAVLRFDVELLDIK